MDAQVGLGVWGWELGVCLMASSQKHFDVLILKVRQECSVKPNTEFPSNAKPS